MCRCRTSMEHYRVKNYLARNKDGHGVSGLGDWKHHDELCKWCAFPNSKKCWQCQKHWEKAADSPASDDTETRRRNEQNQMACFLYVRSVKIGKVTNCYIYQITIYKSPSMLDMTNSKLLNNNHI